jgi:hypothetical protein
MNIATSITALLLAASIHAQPATEPLPGFHRSPWFGEQVLERWIEGDVRAIVNVAGDFDAAHPTRLVVFATPNGNTIEQTLGCGPAKGQDWHFDIQHVAAQVRRVREFEPGTNVVLACIEAEGLSWPAWRKRHADAPARARRIVDWVKGLLPTPARLTLTGHSGGGSFVFANIDSAGAIPDDVERISFLDSNYGYDDASKHGDKLLAWLRGDGKRRLAVIAYDDREIMLNGKKVVSETGGTFRATRRMLDRFAQDMQISESKAGDFSVYSGFGGRFSARVHANPKNIILHTVLVGEMNGVLLVLADGNTRWGTFDGPRAYTKLIQPAPSIPPRPADAPGGAAFMQSIAALSRDAREEAIAVEICRGSVPDFLRTFKPITVKSKAKGGKEHTATYEVMPDYLAVGTDSDFVRVPMSPLTAQRLADAFGCVLPTRKIADDVYKQAAVKLEPLPLTEAREAVETFVKHNGMIEKQRAGKELGQLVAGIKKDVMITNRLSEKPKRVAIYGWHKPDGVPIQPLTIVHVNWYVDYSHGIRLMKRTLTVDGKPQDVRTVLHAADLCGLLSDEGPISWPSY